MNCIYLLLQCFSRSNGMAGWGECSQTSQPLESNFLSCRHQKSLQIWDFEEQKKLLAKPLHTFLLSPCTTHFTALQCDHMQHNASIWIIYKLKALKKGMKTFTEIQMQKWLSLGRCKVLVFGGLIAIERYIFQWITTLNADLFGGIWSVFYALFGSPNLPCYLLKSSGHGRNTWQNVWNNFRLSSRHSRQLPANGRRISGIRGHTLLQPKWSAKHTLTETGSTRWTLFRFDYNNLKSKEKKDRIGNTYGFRIFFFI